MAKDVRSESPFWLIKNGYVEPYRSLIEDIKTDFVVIGGGISGAVVKKEWDQACDSAMFGRRNELFGREIAGGLYGINARLLPSHGIVKMAPRILPAPAPERFQP
ncbi:MAG: hypothetical protein WKF34_07035 [Pyrinomonadaceae bacterium]